MPSPLLIGKYQSGIVQIVKSIPTIFIYVKGKNKLCIADFYGDIDYSHLYPKQAGHLYTPFGPRHCDLTETHTRC